MKILKTVGAALFVFGISGCATNMASDSSFVEATSVGSFAAREYLLPENIGKAFADPRVKAFVVLDVNDPGRNMKICEAYERLPTATIYENMGLGANIVPTYWAVSEHVPDNDNKTAKCQQMVDKYVFPISSAIQRFAKTPRSSTAYLVAMDNERTFYFDLDDGSQEKLDEVMTAWFATAAKNADLPGITLTDWLTGPLGTLCKDGWYEALVQNLPAGKAINDVVALSFRDGECAAAFA